MEIEDSKQKEETQKQQQPQQNQDKTKVIQQLFLETVETLRGIGDNNPQIREKNITIFSQQIKQYSELKSSVDKAISDQYLVQLEGFTEELQKSFKWQNQLSFMYSVENLYQNKLLSQEKQTQYLEFVQLNLQHVEPRIRELACNLVVKFYTIDQFGSKIYQGILNDIKSNFIKNEQQENMQHVSKQKHIQSNIHFEWTSKPGSYTENLIICFNNCNLSNTSNLNEQQVNDIFELIKMCLNHFQRYIRSAGLKMIQDLVKNQFQLNESKLKECLNIVGRGIADNQENVCLQALDTLLSLLEKYGDQFQQLDLSDISLSVFFSRSREAEGIHSLGKKVWKKLLPNNGKQTAAKMISKIIDQSINYCYQCQYQMRFMGCDALKVAYEQLCAGNNSNTKDDFFQKNISDFQANLIKIVEAVLNCCYYEVYENIRVAAFKLLKTLFQAFMEAICKSEDTINQIYECCWFHIPDQVPSVQESSSVILCSLAQAVPQFEKKTMTRLLDELKNVTNKDFIMQSFQQQPMELENYIIPKMQDQAKLTSQIQSDGMIGFATLFVSILESKLQNVDLDVPLIKFLDNLRKIDFSIFTNKKIRIWKSFQVILQKLAEINKKKVKSEEFLENILIAAFRDAKPNMPELYEEIKSLTKFLKNLMGEQILKGRVDQLMSEELTKIYLELIQ